MGWAGAAGLGGRAGWAGGEGGVAGGGTGLRDQGPAGGRAQEPAALRAGGGRGHDTSSGRTASEGGLRPSDCNLRREIHTREITEERERRGLRPSDAEQVLSQHTNAYKRDR